MALGCSCSWEETKMKHEFSVIIPVYNTELFLRKCVESVLRQTYQSYEVIIVNDGSTDRSKEIAEAYGEGYAQIQVITQENKGLGGARNTGIDAACGDYLVFLDSDDYIREDMLEVLHGALQSTKPDVVAYDAYMVDLNGVICNRSTLRVYDTSRENLSGKDLLMMEPTSCLKIYRRELFQGGKIYFPESLWYEDFATIPRVALYAQKVTYLKEPLYYYVQNPDSITHSKYSERMMEIMTAFDCVLRYYKEVGKFTEYYSELEWNCFLHVLYYSAFRLLRSTYRIKEMRRLEDYCANIFGEYSHNCYVEQNKNSRYLMKEIAQRRYWKFYIALQKEKLFSDLLRIKNMVLHQ